MPVVICHRSRIRIVGVRPVGLIGEQKLGDHAARGLGALGLGLDFHAGRRRADAARRQHALAFDLDHADPAIAVGPVAGLRRIAQMRQLDAEPARGAENRFAGADVDLAVVDGEGVGLWLRRRCSWRHSSRYPWHHPCRDKIGISPTSQRLGQFIGKILQHAQAADWAPPGRDRRSRRRASASTVRSAAPRPTGPVAINWAAFSVPTRHGVHWPQLSSSKNLMRLSATAFISSWSDRITTAWEPTKQPYFSRVPKSSGISAMRGRQDAARGAARQIALEGVAVRHAAAEFVDQFARRDAGGRKLHARDF